MWDQGAGVSCGPPVVSLNTFVPYSHVLRNTIYIVATMNRNRKYLIGSKFREDSPGPGVKVQIAVMVLVITHTEKL